ncbi:hypothetical protein TCAL_08714 [Tigriopus californicus]|uniref:Ubiquitin-like protein ATG12 n=1 Tax=Tigriopus californicus TaxID=6832 RepID=A0A553P0I2_TIGCA|nr:hypothetical protein TCAL_08714 [Tigriopus californicus]|eukprot:TCALIF_08714-PA protein Name:"Similar to ATG12 Ubiquitin-like protein ATG12 (Medicago truncatula)" AED:0.07 eAED:0.07 QI:125/0.5/0.66/1/0.5/0.66/3/166/74
MASAEEQSSTIDAKVMVRLQPAGDAPIMQQRNYKFLYVNQAFSPSPDQTVRHLYDCFGGEGKLVLNYAKTPMWG